MTSLHRLIALVIVWICAAGALAVLFESIFLNHMEPGGLIVITAIITAGAVTATYFLIRTGRE